MNAILRKTLSTLLILGMVFSSISMVGAEPYHAFTVEPIYPSNQRSSSVGYYDLSLGASETQTIEVEIKNNGDYAMIATATLFNGSTGDNANGLYDIDTENTNNNKLNTIAKLNSNTIELEPGKNSTFLIDIQVPDKDIKGVIIGAISITADYADEDVISNDKSIQVKNRITYSIPIRLQSNDINVDHDLSLVKSMIRTKDEVSNFAMSIQNSEATHMGNISLTGNVLYNNKVVASIYTETGEILPHTTFDVVFDPDLKDLQAGDYHVDLLIKGNQGEWHFTDVITVDAQQAEETKTEKNSNWLLYLALGILSLLFIFIFLHSIQTKKKG